MILIYKKILQGLNSTSELHAELALIKHSSFFKID